MKKTLVALAVTAFATSASALTVYENEGSKVEFDGSVRVLLEKQSSKANGTKSTDGHTNLKNQGSRFRITVKHNISEDFYALGRYETRFGEGAKNKAGWGSVVTNKAFVGFGGLGHEVTFGKQLVIGDEIGQAGYDNAYDVGSSNITGGFDILTSSSDSAVSYKYTGVEGLTLGANYNFANQRNSAGELNNDAPKSGVGLGAVYEFDLGQGQKVTTSAGYSHDSYKVPTATKKDKDGVYFGLKYAVADFSVAVDGGRGIEKTGNDKKALNFVRTGASYAVTPAVKAYGNYSYGTVTRNTAKTKNTAHQFTLGSSYKVHKNVFTYAEGRVIKNKNNASAKQTDKAIGVGLRVFW